MATWIDFQDAGTTPSGKTRVWWVLTTYDGGGVRLGQVRWYGAWRKYAFFPVSGTLFEPTCLRDLAEFLERRTAEHRQAARARRGEHQAPVTP